MIGKLFSNTRIIVEVKSAKSLYGDHVDLVKKEAGFSLSQSEFKRTFKPVRVNR